MHKNIVSENLKEFALGLEAAVKEGYSVVEESVDFHAGYFKALTQKEYKPEDVKVVLNGEDITSRMTLTVLNSTDALEMLDNPGESNEKLKEILAFDSVVEVPEGVKMETSEGTFVAQTVVQKPKRRK